MTPFEFHTGLTPSQSGHQWLMDCPFCDKPKHFYFNNENLWDCKVCGKSGNVYTFIAEIHKLFDNLVKTSHFISDIREIPVEYIQKVGLKQNILNGSYILPTTNKNGNINNLYKIVPTPEGKLRILATPGIDHTLFNWNETTEDTIWVCEGHWDKIAADAIIASRGITAVAVPGSSVWKTSWCEVLSEKDVVFCYDNDPAGQQGFQKVIMHHIAKSQYKPKSISFLEWPATYKEGYDLNDLYREHRKSAFNKVQEFTKPYNQPEGLIIVKTTPETIEADKSCDSFDKLMNKFRQTYYTTEDMELGLLLAITSIFSTKIEGEQLWLRVIGPPGSGKTTIAKAVSGSERVVLKSTFTGLFSGWRDDSGEDKSLIPLISGKTLIVKDADALLKQPNVQQIFSELRDFYDKDSSTGYRHGFNHDYRNIRSTMILFGTNVLRRADSAFLGERYLDFELKISEEDKKRIARKALENSMSQAANPSSLSPDMPIMAAMKGFIDIHLMHREKTATLDVRAQNSILLLSSLVGELRSKVDREKFGNREITFEPTTEMPTRLIGQLTKMCVCAPVVLGESVMTEKVYKLLYKIARDVIDPSSARLRICKLLMGKYMSRDELVLASDMSIGKVTQELYDLIALKLVKGRKEHSNQPGRAVMRFTLKEELLEGLELLT